MTKKELKDIILKTLEKEGGAAGLKALAKAAKTSKNKLKKDLDDMSGVKQHQDGDYISTPINEIEMASMQSLSSSGKCKCKCPSGHVTPDGNSTFPVSNPQNTVQDCIKVCSEAPCYPLEGGTAYVPPGSGKGDEEMFGIEPIKSPSKPVATGRPVKKPMRRKPMSRKPDKKSKKQLPFVPTFKPVNENLINEGPVGAAKACKACMDKGQCCLIYGSTSNPKVKCIPCPDDAPIEQGKISGGGGVYTQGRNPQLANIVRSAMDREGMSRKPMSKKLMRLREVKEIIEVMLDEKKKKKKDRCHRKADQVYGTKTSAYKSGAIVKCRKGMIWKKKK